MFNERLDFNIDKLHHESKTNTYVASPVKRVYINKDDGTKRPLGIPTVKDRVVQQALRNVIETISEHKKKTASVTVFIKGIMGFRILFLGEIVFLSVRGA